MNRCKTYLPPTEVFIPVQTMEIRPSIDTKDSQTGDIVSKEFPETYSEETQVQENLQTAPLRRSNRVRRAPIRYRDEDNLIIRRGSDVV